LRLYISHKERLEAPIHPEGQETATGVFNIVCKKTLASSYWKLGKSYSLQSMNMMCMGMTTWAQLNTIVMSHRTHKNI
jgi:hypothetical protein